MENEEGLKYLNNCILSDYRCSLFDYNSQLVYYGDTVLRYTFNIYENDIDNNCVNYLYTISWSYRGNIFEAQPITFIVTIPTVSKQRFRVIATNDRLRDVKI